MIDSSSPLPQAIGAVLARETPTGQVSVDLLRVQQHISKIASTSADPRRALVELAAAIGTAFQVEGCSILYSASAGSDSYAIHWKVNALMLPVQTLSISSFPDKAAPSDLTIVPDMERLSSDEAIDPWFRTVLTSWQVTSSPTATPSVIGAALAISTRFHDQVNGRISLMRTHPHSWTTTEIEALTSVSQQVAIVLSHLQLQQQLQQQLQHQAVVNQLTMAIRNSSDITDILNLATNGTSTALQVQRGLLLRLKYWDPLFRSRSSTQTPKVRVTVVCEWFNPSEGMGLFQGDAAPSDHSIEFPSALNQSFWLSECALCQYAFKQSGAPIVINDSRELPGFDSSIGIASVFTLEELPAVLIAPLESQGTVLGF
ncbi:hypothetical protein H6F43_21135, partial [Leptolyngbya sp. FACHB-36]|uniref:GAF domain-containing protein n=1 Tax=Leptolyngbya sp. FACHB-36 TaxID=2692808 RepID=UPI0018F043BD